MAAQGNSTLSRDVFLQGIQRTKTELFDIPGLGAVKIQPLTTEEAQTIFQKYEGNRAGLVTAMIIAGMVEPKLTEADAQSLLQGFSGVTGQLFKRIGELSAMPVTEELENLAGAGSSS